MFTVRLDENIWLISEWVRAIILWDFSQHSERVCESFRCMGMYMPDILTIKQYILVFCLLLQWDMISVPVCGHSAALIKSYRALSQILQVKCEPLMCHFHACRFYLLIVCVYELYSTRWMRVSLEMQSSTWFIFSIQSRSYPVVSIMMCMNVVYLLFSMHMFVLYCLSCKKRKVFLFIKACCTLFTVLAVLVYVCVSDHAFVQQHWSNHEIKMTDVHLLKARL